MATASDNVSVTQTDGICGTPITIRWVLDQISDKTGVFNPKLREYKETRIGIGQGYMSTIVRLQLTWEEGCDTSLPELVVLKVPTCATVAPIMADMMSDAGAEAQATMADDMNAFIPMAHNNECSFYEIMSKVTEPPVPIPIIYGWRKMTSMAVPGAILMEDFSARNAAIVNKADGLTLAQVENLTDCLATMYAWSIESDQDFRTKFVVDPKMLESWEDSMQIMLNKLISTFPEVFTKKDKLEYALTPAYSRFAFGVGCLDKFESLVKIPMALVHGDMWTNNILFKQSADNHHLISDELFALIDWQTAHAGICMEDMARMLISSCSPELRRANKHVLIKRFYNKCASHLSSAPSFTEADLLAAFDLVTPFSTVFYVISVAMMIDNPAIVGEPGTTLFVERRSKLLNRARAALDDCETVKDFVIGIVAQL